MEVGIPGVEGGGVNFEGGECGEEQGPPLGDSGGDGGIMDLSLERMMWRISSGRQLIKS